MDLSRPFAVVTPTLDGDVLTVLALNDMSFTPGQVHRLLGRYSEEGVRRVLRRLSGQGIVGAERVGQAFAYRFNHDHLAAAPVIALATLRSTLFRRLEHELTSWTVPPVFAAVFGSAARGETSADSDVDLLLVRPMRTDLDVWGDQVSHLVARVAAWLGNDVRPLEFTDDEVTKRGPKEPVLADVARDGLILVGQHDWLAQRVRPRKRAR